MGCRIPWDVYNYLELNECIYIYIYCLTLSPVLSGWSRPYHTYWMVFHHFCAERCAWKWHLDAFFEA